MCRGCALSRAHDTIPWGVKRPRLHMKTNLKAAPVRRALAVAAVASALWASPATAQTLAEISITNWGNPLEFANGDNVCVGRFNTLHHVWQDGGLVKYSTSNDGYSWTNPELVAGFTPGSFPAITSDSNGTLVVAFVANPDADGVGTINIARKEWGGSAWAVSQVVNTGTQPDVQARAGRTHLAWSSISRVQYTQFPTSTPPASMSFGEEIEITGCAGTGFLQPSVALTRESCDETVKVGYLRYSDERTNPDGACTSIVTEIGPRVCSRDLSGTWTLEWDDIVQETNPAVGVEGFSFSMNAHYTSANVFAAWSDSSNGVERTVIGHGRLGNWSTQSMFATDHHIHVAANPRSSAGEFRVAWSKKDTGSGDYRDENASYRTGTWTTGGGLVWGEPTPIQLNASQGGGWVERPNAVFWRRCYQSNYMTVEAIAHFESACNAPALRVHLHDGLPCPPGVIIGIKDCWQQHAVAFSHASVEGLAIDTEEFGDPVVVRDREIIFRSVAGDRRAFTRFRWDDGRVSQTWDGGMVIDNPFARVQAYSSDVDVRIQELRRTSIYEKAKERDSCRR